MKKLFILSSMCAIAALASQTAQADVRLRAGAASSTYSLGGDYITAESKYSPVNAGLSFAAENGFYVDLSYSGGTGTHDGWKAAGAPAETFKRTDLALTLGKSFVSEGGIAGTFYGGLKTGQTTLGAQNNPFVSWMEETFTSTGLVFGGGASFPIASGRGGAIGVNAGLGIMGAKWEDDTGFSADAKTAIGGSFGVSYTYSITSNFGVVVDYKYNAYSYDFGDTANPFKVDEKISALGATVYVRF